MSVAVTETPQYQHRNRMVSNFQLHSEVRSMKRSCSNRNKKQGFGGASLHRTRSHGRDIPAEWSQSPVPRTLVARESAASIIPPRYPCLVPVPGSHGRKSHRDPEAGSLGVGRRKRVPQLLAGPLGGWVAGHVEVEDATTIVGQDQKHVEDLKTNGRDRKEIDGNEL